MTVTGDVAGGTVGADYEWDRLLAGLAVAYSGGAGEYRVRGAGERPARAGTVTSWLASVHPYLRFAANERVSVWGLLGYGFGVMTLPDEELETDIELGMGAFGARGELLAPAAAAPRRGPGWWWAAGCATPIRRGG